MPSGADGSVSIYMNMDISDAEKRLKKLEKDIVSLGEEKFEKETFLDRLSSQADAAANEIKKVNDRIVEMQKDSAEAWKSGDVFRQEEIAKAIEKQQERAAQLVEEQEKLAKAADKYFHSLEDTNTLLEVKQQLYNQLRDEIDRKRIGAAQDPFTKMGEGAEVVQTKVSGIKQELQDIDQLIGTRFTSGFQRISGMLKQFSGAAKFTGFASILKGSGNALGKILKGAGDGLNKTLKGAGDALRSILTGAGTALGNTLRGAGSFFNSTLRGAGSALNSSLTGLGRALDSTLRGAGKGIGDILKGAGTGLGSIFKSARSTFGFSNIIKDITSGLQRAVEHVISFGANAVKSFGNAAISLGKLVKKLNIFNKLFGGFGKTFTRIMRMVKRVFFFSIIMRGLNALRQELSLYLSINTQFSTALRRLQGVLYTAFQPIYEAVLPAVTALINVLTRAIATVTQFIAVLFGTTAKQAQANAKSLYDQAHATEAAGKAADKAAGSLAAFDEINQIQTENASGGGGASADTGPLFDWEYDDTEFTSWGEAFSAFLDKMLDGIPKLRDAFKNFADWLNGLNKKLYDMFTFPGVLDKVKRLGRELAWAMNDLVNWIDWELWGRALGAGLNLALNFLTSFLYAFDWINLGRKLAEFINGLVSEIDWYEFGRLLWAGFKIALEMLAGFIIGLKMPELARAASDVVRGFFNEMTNTIKRIDWAEIGRQIARFLQNIKWKAIFDSVYQAIRAALEAIRTLLTGFFNQMFGEKFAKPFVDIVNTIINTIERLMDITREWISGLNFGPIQTAFRNLAAAIFSLVDVISDGLLWAYENVLLPLAEWVIEDAAPRLVNLLAAAIEFLAAALEKLKPVAQWVWDNVLMPIASFAWDIISTGIDTITNAIQKLTDLLRGNTTFKEFLDTLSPGEAIILAIATALGVWFGAQTLINGVIAAFNIVAGAMSVLLGALTAPIGLVITAIGLFAGAFVLLYQHSEKFRSFVDGIVQKIKELIGWFKNIGGAVKDAAKAIADKFTGNKTLSISSGTSGNVAAAHSITGNMPVISTYSAALADMPTISPLAVPAIATGSALPTNREFAAALHGNGGGNGATAAAAADNSQMIALLQQILEATKAGQKMYVNERVLAETAKDGINNLTRQAGKPVLLI